MNQPTKYCADCGRPIAGPSTPPRRYRAIKYCPNCAKERTAWNKANWQKQFRRDRRENNRLLRKENALLRQRVTALERMYQEVRGYV